MDYDSDLGIIGCGSALRGRRRNLEDRFVIASRLGPFSSSGCSIGELAFFAVFDGHAGAGVADYSVVHLQCLLADRLIEPFAFDEVVSDCFSKIDEECAGRETLQGCGTTCSCMIVGKEWMAVANVGDSQGALWRKNGECISLTKTHRLQKEHGSDGKCEDGCEECSERERIENSGGKILHWGGARLNGVLEITRSLGDNHVAQAISTPSTIHLTRLTETDMFAVLATDGIWSAWNFSAPELCTWLAEVSDSRAENDLSELLVNEALARGSTDDMCAIVILFRDSS